MSYSLPIDPFLENFEDTPLSVEGGSLSSQTEEGQLSLDVAQTVDEVVIVATMAGTRPGDFSLHVHGDLLTIRGSRRSPISEGAQHLYQECYWGGFSRTIVLPIEVNSELARAEYKYGVLTIRLPKRHQDSQIQIDVIE